MNPGSAPTGIEEPKSRKKGGIDLISKEFIECVIRLQKPFKGKSLKTLSYKLVYVQDAMLNGRATTPDSTLSKAA